jgi:hypothetical protein
MPSGYPARDIRQIVSPITALIRGMSGAEHLGVCAVCGETVARDHPFLRYRGDYFHGGWCIESDPPALRRDSDQRRQSSKPS